MTSSPKTARTGWRRRVLEDPQAGGNVGFDGSFALSVKRARHDFCRRPTLTLPNSGEQNCIPKKDNFLGMRNALACST